MKGVPAQEKLTIYQNGSDEVSGLIFCEICNFVDSQVPTFPQTLWQDSDPPDNVELLGENWRIIGWELAIPYWPRCQAFSDTIKETVQALIDAGCDVAWVGAEGVPLCGPPALFAPECMSGGCLASLTSDSAFDCPLDPDLPICAISDAKTVGLRKFASNLNSKGVR